MLFGLTGVIKYDNQEQVYRDSIRVNTVSEVWLRRIIFERVNAIIMTVESAIVRS